MSTITITNLTDTPVAGETDLRQAVAEADSGDTIVLASGDFGELIQLKSPLTVTGTNSRSISAPAKTMRLMMRMVRHAVGLT